MYSSSYVRYINLVASVLYAAFSGFLFSLILVLTVVSPYLLGMAVSIHCCASLHADPNGPVKFLVAGGMLASALAAFYVLKTFKLALLTPYLGKETDDPRILALVRGVAQEVGMSGFRGVYLVPGVGNSTFYTARGRFLNLSVLALKYLTADELRAIVAHECAHHHHNAMLLNRVHYRATLFFRSYSQALLGMAHTWKKLSENGQFSTLCLFGLITLFPLFVYVRLYFFLLERMDGVLNDAAYEYYCDARAIQLSGGNVFSAALQKVFDLGLASTEVEQHQSGLPDLSKHLTALERAYQRLRTLNPPERTEAAKVESDSHPALYKRLQKAQDGNHRTDLSEPLFSDTEVQAWLSRLSQGE